MDDQSRRSRLDRTSVKLGIFAVVLAAAFGGGAALGATVGPDPAAPAEPQPAAPTSAPAHGGHG